MTDDDVAFAEAELSRKDRDLGRLIQAHGHLNRLRPAPYFRNLARSIVGQQISVKAAASIYGRLEAATDLDPHKVVTLSVDELRGFGLSRSKATYVRDLAEHFVNDGAVYDHLGELADDLVIAELIQVKGIGVWTAHMFLMFTLGRPDVFAPDDVGLQRAMVGLYGLKAVPAKADLVEMAERWRPYRTVACWHLWHSLDNAPV